MNIEEIIARDRISNDKNIIADIKKHILTTRRVAKEVFDPVSEKFTLIYSENDEYDRIDGKLIGYKMNEWRPAIITVPGFQKGMHSVSTRFWSGGAGKYNVVNVVFNYSKKIEDRTPSSYEEDFRNVLMFVSNLEFIEPTKIGIIGISLNSNFVAKVIADDIRTKINNKLNIRFIALILPAWFGIENMLEQFYPDLQGGPVEALRKGIKRYQDFNLPEYSSYFGTKIKPLFGLDIVINQNGKYQQSGFLNDIKTIADIHCSVNLVFAKDDCLVRGERAIEDLKKRIDLEKSLNKSYIKHWLLPVGHDWDPNTEVRKFMKVYSDKIKPIWLDLWENIGEQLHSGILPVEETYLKKKTSVKKEKELILIYPGNPNRQTKAWLQPLTLRYLKALIEERRPHFRVTVVDDNVKPINSDMFKNTDGVLISGTVTYYQKRAYQIADIVKRETGAPVIMGGVHTSLDPYGAIPYVDSVFIGEAEGDEFLRMLDDLYRGDLQNMYIENTTPPLDKLPFASNIPSDELDLYGLKWHNIFTSRGCNWKCSFCSVHKAFKTYRKRPLVEIKKEMQTRSLSGDFVFVVDDLLFDTKERALEISEVMRQVGVAGWGGQSRIQPLWEYPEILKKLGESRCVELFVGVETLNEKNLKDVHKSTIPKGMKPIDFYYELQKRAEDHGISLFYSLIIGLDNDSFDTAKRQLDLLNKVEAINATFHILQPRIGTKLRDQFLREGRIKYIDNWRKYSDNEVVFNPNNFGLFGFDRPYLFARWRLKQAYKWLNTQWWNKDIAYNRLEKAEELGKPIGNARQIYPLMIEAAEKDQPPFV